MQQKEMSEKEMLATMREDQQRQYIEAREKLLKDLTESPRFINGVLIEKKCAETGCEADIYRETVKRLEKRNLDLSGDVGKLSAITVVALDLLKRFVQQSREPDEGDCVYCNCEFGGGNEYHCYSDCIITEVRKLLDAVEKGQSVSVDKAVLHDLQENNWSIPEHEDDF